MRKAERVLIYGGLVTAILLGLGWRGPEHVALAAGAPVAPQADMRLATVDILKVVEKFVKSDKYAPARDAFNRDLTTKLKTMAEALDALRGQIQASPQNAPETQGLMQNYQQRAQEFDQERQKAAQASDEFNAKQIAEAYRIVMAAIDDISTKGGYTHVLATRGGPAVLKATNIAGTVQEMLARPLLKGNPADDLTKAVSDELKLPELDETPPASTSTPTSSPTSTPTTPPGPAPTSAPK